MGADYEEFAPPPDLSHAVAACWIGAGTSARIPPDGCIDLIFQGGGSGQARLFTSALLETAVVMPERSGCWFAGIRFKPGMSRVALDLNPRDCLNLEMNARSIDPCFGSIQQQLTDCRGAYGALRVLITTIAAKVKDRPNCKVPSRVRTAVSLLGSQGGYVRIADVARSLGISERSLHRDLVTWTGLRPNLLSRIFRLQRTLGRIRAGHCRMADTACEMGYADQAHMTPEIQQLTGVTPSAFARNPAV